MFIKNIKGVTLIEVFLAAFIFVISSSAILASLVALRRPTVNNEQEKEAALAGKFVLEQLRAIINPTNINISTGDYVGDLQEGSNYLIDSVNYLPCTLGTPTFHCRVLGNYKVTWIVTCTDSRINDPDPSNPNVVSCTSVGTCIDGSSGNYSPTGFCLRQIDLNVTWTDAT